MVIPHIKEFVKLLADESFLYPVRFVPDRGESNKNVFNISSL